MGVLQRMSQVMFQWKVERELERKGILLKKLDSYGEVVPTPDISEEEFRNAVCAAVLQQLDQQERNNHETCCYWLRKAFEANSDWKKPAWYEWDGRTVRHVQNVLKIFPPDEETIAKRKEVQARIEANYKPKNKRQIRKERTKALEIASSLTRWD